MGGTTDQDLRGQQARIQQLQNDALLKALDSLKRVQDIRYAPVTLVAASVAGVAALFGSALAFLKWLG